MALPAWHVGSASQAQEVLVMKNKRYELVSGSIFGVIALLQAMRAVFQIPAQVGAHDVPVWASWLAFGVAGSLCLWAVRTATSASLQE